MTQDSTSFDDSGQLSFQHTWMTGINWQRNDTTPPIRIHEGRDRAVYLGGERQASRGSMRIRMRKQSSLTMKADNFQFSC
jgi:hypothetical protein